MNTPINPQDYTEGHQDIPISRRLRYSRLAAHGQLAPKHTPGTLHPMLSPSIARVSPYISKLQYLLCFSLYGSPMYGMEEDVSHYMSIGRVVDNTRFAGFGPKPYMSDREKVILLMAGGMMLYDRMLRSVYESRYGLSLAGADYDGDRYRFYGDGITYPGSMGRRM